MSPDPVTLEVRSVTFRETEIVVTLVATSPTRVCPSCRRPGERVHSRYWRDLADLPIRRVPVRLRILARRFFCQTVTCRQRIFAERLGEVAQVAARRTRRVRVSLRDIGQSDGGEKGARLARRLGMPTSPDSLLRLIREGALPQPPNPRVIGVDEWAKRKGRSYGAIVVDLERHQVVDLLEDATAATFAHWLQAHPGAEVISRDRGGAFAEGGREGAPNAIQIADRFHLLKNLGDAVEEYLVRVHRQLPPQPQPPATAALSAGARASAGPALSPPRVPRHVHERQQQRDQRRNRRFARYNTVIALHQKGMSAQRIARSLDLDRKTVYKYLQAGEFPERAAPAKRRSVLDPFRGYLQQRWDEGCHNALQLFRELQGKGFRGKKSIVAAVLAPLRQRQSPAIAEVIAAAPNQRMSPRQVRWVFVGNPDELPPATRDALETFLAEQAEARGVYELAQRFGQMVRERRPADLDAWLTEAGRGPREMRRLVAGIERDRAAVEAALTYAWSQGQTEGQINRLKLTKRSMFGRASFDLLRRRVLEAA